MTGGRMTLPAEPVDQSRARFDALFNNIKPMLPPPTDAVKTTDLEVPASKQKIRIYKPTAATGPLPVGLYIQYAPGSGARTMDPRRRLRGRAGAQDSSAAGLLAEE